MQISLNHLWFVRSGNQILQDINLTLNENQHYCLIGPNGAGKTTLLSILCGIEWPTKGNAFITELYKEPTPLPHSKKSFGYFMPKYATYIETYHPTITPIELICTGFNQALANYIEPTPQQRQHAEKLFHTYIASTKPNRPFHTLSTGERFRILLLRTLVTAPPIVILDEPFDGLDLPGRLSFEKLIIDSVANHARLSLSVLHRIEEIPTFVTNIILLKNGRIVSQGPKSQILTSENLSNLYDMKLICHHHNGRYYVVND